MGFFDGLFGGFLDLNGDGYTDVGEEFMGFLFLNDSEKARRREQVLPVDDSDDDLF